MAHEVVGLPIDKALILGLMEQYEELEGTYFPAYERELAQMVSAPEIEVRLQAVLVVSLEAVAHRPISEIERHVEAALDVGSNVQELIEAIMHLASLEAGEHGLHDGLEAIARVTDRREDASISIPEVDGRLASAEYLNERPWPTPPVFPYQEPAPRHHIRMLRKYHPELWEAFKAWNQASFLSRKALTRRTQELLVIGCDAGIAWPEPMFDHHIHAAFELGCTVQEVVEVVALTAVAVPEAIKRARDGAGQAVSTAVLDYGLTALDRVVRQRRASDFDVRINRESPWKHEADGDLYLSEPDGLPPHMLGADA